MTDGRCRFGPRAKREMVARLLAGEKARQVARSMGCSPTTVTTARDRWLAASEAERASGAWCVPRRPVPLSCPWALSREAEQVILDAGARTNWGPMRLTWLTGRHRSSCWKVLKRHGVSRQRRSNRPQSTRRYELDRGWCVVAYRRLRGGQVPSTARSLSARPRNAPPSPSSCRNSSVRLANVSAAMVAAIRAHLHALAALGAVENERRVEELAPERHQEHQYRHRSDHSRR